MTLAEAIRTYTKQATELAEQRARALTALDRVREEFPGATYWSARGGIDEQFDTAIWHANETVELLLAIEVTP